MDRVSGWYKAYAQKNLFVLGLLAAILANVDAIEIFQTFNRSPDVRSEMARIATEVGHTGKIGDVDLTALRDRPPTNQEWRSILKRAADESQTGVLARLPIGYGCLNAVADIGTTPGSPAASAGTTWKNCKAEFDALRARTSISGWLLKLLGFVLSALAAVLGAPYWFAALSKIVNIRGSGPKPAPAAQK